jgi:hypothetical protein
MRTPAAANFASAHFASTNVCNSIEYEYSFTVPLHFPDEIGANGIPSASDVDPQHHVLEQQNQ